MTYYFIHCLSIIWSFLFFTYFFFFNDTATTEIYTLSLHDALPICPYPMLGFETVLFSLFLPSINHNLHAGIISRMRDRKSTRLNSSHSQISYAVFCLKKKKKKKNKKT